MSYMQLCLNGERLPFGTPVAKAGGRGKNFKKEGCKMVREFVVCDHCHSVIANPEDGFIVKGNIYNADHGEFPERLVGDNFPTTRSFAVRLDEIGETGICKSCMCKALGLEVAQTITTVGERYLAKSA